MLETHAEEWENRRIVFQRVKAPRNAEVPEQAGESAPASGDAAPVAPPAPLEEYETVDLTLAATVVDRRATLLRWSWEGERYEAWSNADWMLLAGVGQCRKGDRLFSTLLLSSSVDSATLPEDSPLRIPAELSAEPGAFRLIAGDSSNDAALETVRVLHELYRNELPRLRRAFAAREERRRQREAEKAALLANPPDIAVRYWKVPKNNENHDNRTPDFHDSRLYRRNGFVPGRSSRSRFVHRRWIRSLQFRCHSFDFVHRTDVCGLPAGPGGGLSKRVWMAAWHRRAGFPTR